MLDGLWRNAWRPPDRSPPWEWAGGIELGEVCENGMTSLSLGPRPIFVEKLHKAYQATKRSDRPGGATQKYLLFGQRRI